MLQIFITDLYLFGCLLRFIPAIKITYFVVLYNLRFTL